MGQKEKKEEPYVEDKILMSQFITIEEFKAMPLPISEKQWNIITDEALLNTIIQASDHLEDWMDRKIDSAEYTERVLGNGMNFLILENRPVTAVTEISSTDFTGGTRSWDEALVVVESKAGLVRWIDASRYYWSRNAWWDITYEAGYATVPNPIKRATALQTLEMLQPIFRGGSQFVEVELIEGINTDIVDLLEPYKNKRIG